MLLSLQSYGWTATFLNRIYIFKFSVLFLIIDTKCLHIVLNQPTLVFQPFICNNDQESLTCRLFTPFSPELELFLSNLSFLSPMFLHFSFPISQHKSMLHFIFIVVYRLYLSTLYPVENGIVISVLLLLSGDIESNPGPDNDLSTRRTPMKHISFCHINIRSLVQQSDCGARFNHFYNYACRDNTYDLVALTETHLSPEIDDDEINLDGYDLFRLDRNRHGGGVAIYCRSELEPKIISKLSIQNIEMLWIETSVQNKQIIFGVCYRPPNQNADERSFFLDGLHSVFDEVLDIIKLPFILLGDFNDRCTSWGKDHKTSELKLDLVELD